MSLCDYKFKDACDETKLKVKIYQQIMLYNIKGNIAKYQVGYTLRL